MRDLDTFLTTLSVMVDDFCPSHLPHVAQGAGRPASLQWSEVITLSLCGQGVPFPSERAFSRDAEHPLCAAFPDVPDRGHVNGLMRANRDAMTAFGLDLLKSRQAQSGADEALASTAVVTRKAKRRGAGWFPGQADSGGRNRLGWSEGFHLLLLVTPIGVIPGFGFAAARASIHDQLMAETLVAVRQTPSPRLPRAGLPAHSSYVADKGCAGENPHQRWPDQRQVDRVTPPPQNSKRLPWPNVRRRWVASIRQSIETVNENLLTTLSSGS